ncbi:MAG: hypothetical protein ACLRWA_08725 [Lachnospira sp.]
MAENSIITKKARENMVKARAGAITLQRLSAWHSVQAGWIPPGM